MSINSETKGRWLSLSATLLASFFPLFFQKLGNYTSPLEGISLLFAISLVLSTLPFTVVNRRFLCKKGVFWIVLVALTSLAGNWLYFVALQGTGAAIASSILRIELVFVAILGALFLSEKITIGVIIAILLSLIGIFYLQGGVFEINPKSAWPITASLLSALSFSLMLLCSKIALKYTGVENINLYRLLLLVLFMLLFTDSFYNLFQLPSIAWLLALLCAVCGPMGARYLFTSALKYVSMTKATLYTMLAPALTAVWQWLFLEYDMTMTEAFGVSMIVCGLIGMVAAQHFSQLRTKKMLLKT